MINVQLDFYNKVQSMLQTSQVFVPKHFHTPYIITIFTRYNMIILHTVYIQMLPTVPITPLNAFPFPIWNLAQDEACIRLSCLLSLL